MINETISIYDSAGTLIAAPLTTTDAERVEELMASDYLQLAWQSDGGAPLPAGAYIMFRGEKMSLLDPYEPEQKDEAEWSYRPRFQSRVMGWQKIPFFHYSYGHDNTTITAREPDWTLTDTPANFMAAICKAIKNETGETWTYEVAVDLVGLSATLSFAVSDIYSGLNEVAGAFETEWRADKSTNTLCLGKAQFGEAIQLKVGDNVGVPSVTKSKTGYYNRFYVFGSTRNITQDYQGANVNNLVNKRLTLDKNDHPGGYIDTPRDAGTPVYPKVLTFDDIYPHSGLTVANLRPRLMYRLDEAQQKIQVGTDTQGEPVYDMYTIWYFQLPGFTLNDTTYSAENPDGMLIAGKPLSVHFRTGALTNREFELIYHSKAELLHNSDGLDFQVLAGDYEIKFVEESGLIIPMQTGIVPADGDEVILYNLRMPSEYITTAQEELEAVARKEIAESYTSDLNNYTVKSNPVAFAASDPGLEIGRKVLYVNGDYSYATRVIKLVTKLDNTVQQEITIGNEKIKGSSTTLKEQVVNANSNIDLLTQLNQLNQSVTQAYQRAQQMLLDNLAQGTSLWEKHPTLENTIIARFNVVAQGHILATKDVTAYAKGVLPGGDAPSSGVTDLRSLDDVILTNPKAGQILKYDGQHWVNGTIDAGLNETALAAYLQANRYAKLSDIPSLAGYATRSWVENKGYATEAWVIAQHYLTEHQDISHLLTRAEFDEMFERIDTDGGGWYILAKSHLASVGDVTAYGTGGPGSTLGGIGDVQLGSLAAGDVIKWDGQHWVNGPAPAGGVDEEQLAAYLTANNYITQADLGNYVTLDGAQTITGGKLFSARETFFTRQATVNGNYDTFDGCPRVMWHVPKQQFTKMQMDVYGNLHLLHGAATALNDYRGLTVSSIAKYGGTASQFLKADGSVDDTSYFRHRRDTPGLNIDSAITAGGIYEVNRAQGTLPFASDWHQVFDWDTGDALYRVQMCTGYTNNSSMYFRHKYVGNWQPWREILDSVNYAGILDGRYVNKAGDTMTGPLRIAHSATSCVLYTQYNTAGAYSNVIWANVDESRVLFGSPHWITVELETANSATAAYRRTNGVQYKIWDSGNHGSGSGLDADLLDGHHGGDYFRHRAGYISADYFNGVAFRNLNPGTYIYSYSGASGLLVSFGNLGASASSLELYTTYPDEADIKYRKKIDSNRFAGGWNTLITNHNIWAYNAGSATKLQTARSLWGNNFDGTVGCGGGLTFDLLTGTNARNLLYQKMADNDFFRIRCGASASNAGWVEIATADDGTEPIYVRQYTGEFATVTRTLTLLDGSGNTYLPGHLVVSGDVTAYSDARLKSDVQTLCNRGFITPRTYIKDGKRCIGFLAQEVRQRYPELVTDTGGADHWLALNYGNLVAVLEAQIIDHEERIKRLEARI
ncbi:pyocin knob domain-containing protein [Paramuribaculum intestinale]|uniref:pyocin knob domain-containing protein n=2 Tax=Paramuribaculum intestinale TaxID=2094151 RepID=UPI0025AA03DA|nr:pyocin knob domain-containing protein [Paramuribaculum intestinale]